MIILFPYPSYCGKETSFRYLWLLSFLLAALLVGCTQRSMSIPPPSLFPIRVQSIIEEGKKALSRGDSDLALQKFHLSLQISEEQNLLEGAATSLHSISLTHIQRKEWRQALLFMERTLAIDRKLLGALKADSKKNNLQGAKIRLAEIKVASDLNDLARLHQRLGDPRAALKRLGELLATDLRLGREKGAAITHNNIARIFLALDDLEKARRHFLLAMVLFIKNKDERRANAVRQNLKLLETIKKHKRESPITQK